VQLSSGHIARRLDRCLRRSQQRARGRRGGLRKLLLLWHRKLLLLGLLLWHRQLLLGHRKLLLLGILARYGDRLPGHQILRLLLLLSRHI
jgi:hypothetical protein